MAKARSDRRLHLGRCGRLRDLPLVGRLDREVGFGSCSPTHETPDPLPHAANGNERADLSFQGHDESDLQLGAPLPCYSGKLGRSYGGGNRWVDARDEYGRCRWPWRCPDTFYQCHHDVLAARLRYRNRTALIGSE
jgi:hypothetical protein